MRDHPHFCVKAASDTNHVYCTPPQYPYKYPQHPNKYPNPTTPGTRHIIFRSQIQLNTKLLLAFGTAATARNYLNYALWLFLWQRLCHLCLIIVSDDVFGGGVKDYLPVPLPSEEISGTAAGQPEAAPHEPHVLAGYCPDCRGHSYWSHE